LSLVSQGRAIADRYPLDYGEAPLVDQALRLASGRNIYRADLSAPPYTVANYPPVYVAALAPLTTGFGPSFAPGRLVSALCAWAAAACLGLILFTHSRDGLAAVAALTFLAVPHVTFWSSLVRIDLLALALSLAALSLLVRWPAARWSLVAAILLLVAAIYTRQSYALAAPLAALVWLRTETGGWRRPLGLAAGVGSLVLALFFLIEALTHGGFSYNTVTANVNEFHPSVVKQHLSRFGVVALVLAGLGGASLLVTRRRNPLFALAAPYAVGAVLSALTIGKVGSNVNYFLELCAASSLAAEIVVVWSRRHVRAHVLRALLLALLALQAGRFMRITFSDYVGILTARRAEGSELRRMEAMVAEADGPVLADEHMGLITLQGRPLYLQPFEVTQLAKAGVWDQTPLLASIHQQQFPLILIDDRPWSLVRWTPEMLSAIEKDYRLTERLAGARVYRPAARAPTAAKGRARRRSSPATRIPRPTKTSSSREGRTRSDEERKEG
jgi:hypothetical protein